MKLYDFSAYAEKRNALKRERLASREVVEVVAHINRPGSIIVLKEKVDGWFNLHKQVIGGRR